LWCNLDVTLRNLDQIYGRAAQPYNLTIIEWYILRSLYEQDGQQASELARSVGRAATSFTPNLDKLEKKGLVERANDPGDRRAIRIVLTAKAKGLRDEILSSAELVDQQVNAQFNAEELEVFYRIIAALQTLQPDYSTETVAGAPSSNGRHD
jgi:DNA-binding MarR family transcriptional regulator